MAYRFKFDYTGGETLPTHTKLVIDNLLEQADTLNFVGWRPDTGIDTIVGYAESGKHINVIEIYNMNVVILENLVQDYNNIKVIYNDIRLEYQKHNGVLIWQDGPEHLEINESKNILEDMKKYYNAIIIATPKGEYPQGTLFGNAAERHLSSWLESDYEDISFNWSYYVESDKFLIGYWSK